MASPPEKKKFKSAFQNLAPEREVMEILECPVCQDTFSGKIFQCLGGHSICEDCMIKIAECPTCKVRWSGTRNFSLERIIQSSIHSCCFQGDGCKFVGRGDVIQKHIDGCGYRPTKCPYFNFSWLQGTEKIFCKTSSLKLSEIGNHLEQIHHLRASNSETLTMTSSTFSGPLDKMENQHKLYCSGVLRFDSKAFSLTAIGSKVHKRLFIFVLFHGPREEEGNYRAEIVVQPGKKRMRVWNMPALSTFNRTILTVLGESIHLPNLSWGQILEIMRGEGNVNTPFSLNFKCTITKFEA